jgi:uroporphyrinogen-III synthase
MTGQPTVAVFRPDDERLREATALLDDLGVEPVADPMLAVEETGNLPRSDGEYTILTSKTGAEILAGTDWKPGGQICAIGEATEEALAEAGYAVDIVPETYSSSGMVDRLADEIEVARSDHGSAVLLDGLEEAGAYVHETILYRLVRPDGSGASAELAAEGNLDAVLFTSSLTVENFLEAADERRIRDATIAGLDDGIVATIGEPTRETAEVHGLTVDVVADTADFETLARSVVDEL